MGKTACRKSSSPYRLPTHKTAPASWEGSSDDRHMNGDGLSRSHVKAFPTARWDRPDCAFRRASRRGAACGRRESLAMSDLFHDQGRTLQDRFDTRRLADRIEERLVADRLDDEDRAFVEHADMFFLATVDHRGYPTCSYKGGDPGFVRALDDRTIVFPNYDGNGMYLSMGNLDRDGKVGLLFIDFEHPSRLRIHGDASIDTADPLMSTFPEAQFVVRVRVREVFPNCPRYIHRYALVERSRFVPHAGVRTPVPDWKRSDWAVDVLPHDDVD